MAQPPFVPGPQSGQVWPPNPSYTTDPFAAPPPPKKSRLPWLLAAAALAAALVATLGVVLFVQRGNSGEAAAPSAWEQEQAASASPFKSAQRRCDEFQEGTKIADGGKTLIIDGAGEETTAGLSVTSLECLVKELGMPESVKAQMFDTRALDGRQTGTWPGFSASWSYHPDDGMDVVITQAK